MAGVGGYASQLVNPPRRPLSSTGLMGEGMRLMEPLLQGDCSSRSASGMLPAVACEAKMPAFPLAAGRMIGY